MNSYAYRFDEETEYPATVERLIADESASIDAAMASEWHARPSSDTVMPPVSAYPSLSTPLTSLSLDELTESPTIYNRELKIGRESCRERVYISVVDLSLKKK